MLTAANVDMQWKKKRIYALCERRNNCLRFSSAVKNGAVNRHSRIENIM